MFLSKKKTIYCLATLVKRYTQCQLCRVYFLCLCLFFVIVLKKDNTPRVYFVQGFVILCCCFKKRQYVGWPLWSEDAPSVSFSYVFSLSLSFLCNCLKERQSRRWLAALVKGYILCLLCSSLCHSLLFFRKKTIHWLATLVRGYTQCLLCLMCCATHQDWVHSSRVCTAVAYIHKRCTI